MNQKTQMIGKFLEVIVTWNVPLSVEVTDGTPIRLARVNRLYRCT